MKVMVTGLFAENDIPDVLDCWDHRWDAKFQQKRTQRVADLQRQIAPLKSDRLEHHAIIHRLKFEEIVCKMADKARATREKAEAELAELQSRITPLQTETAHPAFLGHQGSGEGEQI